MMECKTCKSTMCDMRGKFEVFCYGYDPKTNGDRIRAMTDEELAWELMTWRIETAALYQGIESNYPRTKADIFEWLKRPAEGER